LTHLPSFISCSTIDSPPWQKVFRWDCRCGIWPGLARIFGGKQVIRMIYALE
jgi:hypothetical protein